MARNPYTSLAEAAGKYALEFIRPTRKENKQNPASEAVIYFCARWAAHWASKALNHEEKAKAEASPA